MKTSAVTGIVLAIATLIILSFIIPASPCMDNVRYCDGYVPFNN